MAAVALRARADLHRRWRSWLLLALLIGALAGGLIAAAGGARRVSSAYERFTTATRAADIGVVPGCRQQAPDGSCADAVDPSELAVLDAVDEMALGYSWAGPVTRADGTVLNPAGDPCTDSLSVIGTSDGRLGTTVNGFLLVAGRRSQPDRADEVVLSLAAAQRAGVQVGDELLAYLHAGDCVEQVTWGSPTPVRVVGIGQMAGEVPGSHGLRFEGVHATPALTSELLSDTRLNAPMPVAFVRLVRGASTEDFVAAAEAAGMPISILIEADSLREGVEQRLIPDSTVLWLVAALGGLAAVVVLGSAVAHVGAAGTGDAPVLHSLGWRRHEFAAWGTVEGAAIGVVAATVATVLAVAVSDVVTIGDARQIDPERGLRLDWWPIVLGAAITMAVVTSAFAIGRLGAVRRWLGTRRAANRPRRSDVLLARLPGLPVTAVAGVRFATAPATRGAVPFWRGAAGLTFGLFGLVAAITFLAGVDHLVTTPRLAGVNWDAMVWIADEAVTAQVDDSVDRLRRDSRVRAISAGIIFPPFEEVTAGEARIQIFPMSFSTGPNAVAPTVIDGRAPAGPDEILLNPLLVERLHVAIGQNVDVRAVATDATVATHPFEVVGTGVVPVVDGRPEVGSAMTLDGLRRMAPRASAQVLFIDLDDNVSVDSVLRDLELELDTQGDFFAGDVVEQLLGINVTRARQAPIVLATVLGIMAAGVLAHLSASAVRARTHEIAVIRALGFDGHQVRRAMGWMVTILSGASLALALPFGVLAGRAAFVVYAERLGVPPEPAVPVWTLAGLLPGVLLVAYVVSLWPSWQASKVATATVLRSE